MNRNKELAEHRIALRELSEAARNACDAYRHPPLTEALFRADELLVRDRKAAAEWNAALMASSPPLGAIEG